MDMRRGIKARQERLYANAIMYIARGDFVMAEKYLNESALQLKEYILLSQGDEKTELREWFLELYGHLKELKEGASLPQQRAEKQLTQEKSSQSLAFAKEEIPSVSFSDVVGLERVKEQIYDMIIYPRKYRELYDKFQKKLGGGILLYGPPGNGKTMVAKAITHETGSTFFPVKFSDFGSKWFGETEGKIRDLFEEARKEESAVIFFDEIDAIAAKRTDTSIMDRVVAELLVQLDGINRTKGNLTVLAATNKLESIDPAILRPGRFDEKIYIPLPGDFARASMFEKHLCGVPSQVSDFVELASASIGLSGAEIAFVCEKAKQTVIRSIISGSSPDQKITKEHIIDAINSIKSA